MHVVPVHLPPNQFDHFYRGGDRISALRGGPGGPMRPEDWIGSTVTRWGDQRSGLSALPDGRLLRDAVASDPRAWLGPDHVAAFGPSTELLVKLLDPDQRLPVHFHPDKAFARRHSLVPHGGLDHGKTEAWLVLEAAAGAGVGLGFLRPMTGELVLELVERRDSAGLLAALHHREVRPGDAILVPAGVPHAIDAGVLFLELQEPTDLSALLEWEGFALDGPRDGHLGLGFPTVIGALRLDPLSDAEHATLIRNTGLSGGEARSLFPPAADGYFRAHLLPAAGEVPPGFAVALVLDGQATLSTEHAGTLPVRRGEAVVVPWAAGRWRAEGAGVVACRPPLAGPAAGAR